MYHCKSTLDEAEPMQEWSSYEDEGTSYPKRRLALRTAWGLRLLVAAAVLGYMILVISYINLQIQFASLQSKMQSSGSGLFPSISKSTAFRSESRTFPLVVNDTPFAGPPTPELDYAWHELLEGMTIRVSKEDLYHYNVTSLPLADGSGFASQMFVAHELHCLKKVRQWVYKESYFEDVQGLARNELERHIDHCIETLRQGIMCRGDVSLGTYTYLSGGGHDITARNWASHQCVDFKALTAWAKARAVDILADGVLVKPEDVGPEHITERKEPH